MTEHDSDLVERLRSAYRTWDVGPGRPLDPIITRARRVRRRRAETVGAAVLVSALAVAGVGVALHQSSHGGTPANRPNAVAQTSNHGTREMRPPSSAFLNRIADKIYAQLDRDPLYGYYMLKVNAPQNAITVWRNVPAPRASDDAIRQIAERASVALILRPQPDPKRWESSGRADRVHAAADQLRRMATADPAYQFNFIKLEIPLNTVVVWRGQPSGSIDRRLSAAAARAGIHLDLRHARFSATHLVQIGNALHALNTRWTRYGFTVNGAYPRPAGAIVIIRGDLVAARMHLANHAGVLAVERDDGVNLPLNVPKIKPHRHP